VEVRVRREKKIPGGGAKEREEERRDELLHDARTLPPEVVQGCQGVVQDALTAAAAVMGRGRRRR